MLNMTQAFVLILLQLVPIKPLQSEKGKSLRPIHNISTLRMQCPYMTTAIGNTHCDKPSCGSGFSQPQDCLCRQSHSTEVSAIKHVTSNQPSSFSVYNKQSEISPNILTSISPSSVTANLLPGTLLASMAHSRY